MQDISKWRELNLRDRQTYPLSNTRIQVKLTDGSTDEADCDDFFPPVGLLYRSHVTAWRYVRGTNAESPRKQNQEPLNGYLLLPG